MIWLAILDKLEKMENKIENYKNQISVQTHDDPMREKLANSDQSHTKESLAHETPERHASGLTDNLK